ncbi:AAA domain-containing protein [Mycobacterium sp.]|uniref:AAA domain-containing protein n=1 Tax=Mycobacterium sp. TaxID=1785 RepID=UPI0025D5EE2A|nr:AAA domain-containing protein [Mycobacterium sp.]
MVDEVRVLRLLRGVTDDLTILRRESAADETRRATCSAQEAELIAAEIAGLIATPWTNQHGEVNPLGTEDFMVVTPYNEQVRLLRQRLAADTHTAEVLVGTVDKFQGR